MFFHTSLWGRKLPAFVLLIALSLSGQSQSLESVAFSLTLPDGQTAGIQQRSSITNLVQRPEGLYVLTESDGCYLLSSQASQQHKLLAQPTDRREKFNCLIKKDKEVHLLVNYQSFRPLVHQEDASVDFTSSFFAKTVNPTSIHYADDGRIIVGSLEDGLFVFEPDEYGGYSNVPERFSTAGQQLPSNIIHTIYEDQRGVIWIGTDRGLATLTNDTIYNLGMSPPMEQNWWQRFWGVEGPPPLYSGPVKAIAEWGDSIVFAGEEALYRVPTRPDSLALVYEYDLHERLPEPLTDIQQLLVDINGDLWVAANQLLRFNITRDELRIFGRETGLRGQGISTLLEDVEMGEIWIGTQRGGLYRMSNDPYSRIGH